jgi:hypothetical protein
MLGSGSSACEILDANGNLRDVAPASNADFSEQSPKSVVALRIGPNGRCAAAEIAGQPAT